MTSIAGVLPTASVAVVLMTHPIKFGANMNYKYEATERYSYPEPPVCPGCGNKHNYKMVRETGEEDKYTTLIGGECPKGE